MSVEKKETLIQVQNLTKTFGGSVHALNGVSTDIKKGEVVCVIVNDPVPVKVHFFAV